MPETIQAPTLPTRQEEARRLMRRAGNIIGSEKLADLLGISARNCYQLMSGKRAAKDGIIADTRRLLIEHRQFTGTLIRDFRSHEGLQFGETETGADDEA